jgi:hypothetical protein
MKQKSLAVGECMKKTDARGAGEGASLNVDAAAMPTVDRRLPLQLAKQYSFGLRRGYWSSQSEAASLINTTQGQISKALALTRLPKTVLSCFHSPDEIDFGVAAELAVISRKIGIEAMIARATAINALPNAIPAKRVLAILEDGVFRQADRGGARSSGKASGRVGVASLPLDVWSEYREGYDAGKWISAVEAATHLKHSGSRISRAIKIGSLPSEILSLFDASAPLTFECGIKLLKLRTAMGIEALVENACDLRGKCVGFSAKEIVDALAIGDRASIGTAGVKLTVSYQGRFLQIHSNRIDLLVAAKAEIERFLDVIVNRAATRTMLDGTRLNGSGVFSGLVGSPGFSAKVKGKKRQ